MKVLITAETLSLKKTGIQQYVVQLIRALSRRGDIEVAVLGSTRESDGSLPQQVRWIGAHAVPFSPVPWILARAPVFAEFDVVHCTSVLPPYLFKPRSPALVMTIHDVIANARPDLVSRKMRIFYSLALPPLAKSMDAVITDSSSAASDIALHLEVPSDRIHRVPLASRWPVAAAPELILAKDDYFLAVGNIEPRKNLARVIEAFHQFRSSRCGAEHQLLIVGKRGWGSRESELAAASSGSVRWLGYVSDEELRRLYRRAKALLFPSLYEGFGLPVLEAMSQGCPVITSRVTSIPEVAGDAALYVDPADVGALAEALRRLSEDSATRESLIERGIDRAGLFDENKTAAETLRAYQEALDRRRARS